MNHFAACRRAALLCGLIGIRSAAGGPFAPAAGQTNSTAIYKDSPEFTAWASGWTDYIVGAECSADWQVPERALGKAEGLVTYGVVSLGRGGTITLTFAEPITDGPGWDFAVFENAFNDNFLELAYVEVSSDGIHFFRFDNCSLTPTNVSSYGYVDPTDVDGLAGKYRGGYGTPFDLGQLAGVSPYFDSSRVGWVRLRDVVGDGTCTDNHGHVIYDPYPTMGSAGFDLDAVGIINVAIPCRISSPEPGKISLKWHAATNRTYRVEYTTSLVEPHWSALGPDVSGDGLDHEVSDVSPADGCRFYRIVTVRVPKQ